MGATRAGGPDDPLCQTPVDALCQISRPLGSGNSVQDAETLIVGIRFAFVEPERHPRPLPAGPGRNRSIIMPTASAPPEKWARTDPFFSFFTQPDRPRLWACSLAHRPKMYALHLTR